MFSLVSVLNIFIWPFFNPIKILFSNACLIQHTSSLSSENNNLLLSLMCLFDSISNDFMAT